MNKFGVFMVVFILIVVPTLIVGAMKAADMVRDDIKTKIETVQEGK